MKYSFFITAVVPVLCYGYASLYHEVSNKNPIHETIYNDASRVCTEVQSMQTQLKVTYVENSNDQSMNPHFPAIHMGTDRAHDGWIHLVYTDSAEDRLSTFVDAADPTQYPEIYPCYTCDQDFYDAPLWSYESGSKPISYWRGHAYAVTINTKTKEIVLLAGVIWGFRLLRRSFYPKMITPSGIDFEQVKLDIAELQKLLPDYRFSY